MNNHEKEKQGEEDTKRTPCWGPDRWAEYCSEFCSTDSDRFSGEEASNNMAKCFNRCRYFLLLPVMLGVIFLFIGYLLSPGVIRVLWMVGAGMVAGMGLFGVLIMQYVITDSGFSGCCGAWFRQKT